MSAAAAAPAATATPKAGKKKLVLMLAAVLLLVIVAGGAGMWWLSHRAAQAESDDADAASAEQHAEAPRAAPVFVSLEPFTVNLADREGERYAQIGITLEVEDAKVGDQIKAYMPAIRNNILMVLAHKTSAELLQREGKLQLAAEIRRETLRPLGVTLPDEGAAAGDAAARPKGKRQTEAAPVPVRQVHFSNFIIQ